MGLFGSKKKIIVFIAACILAVCTMAGCGGSTSEGNSAQKEEALNTDSASGTAGEEAGPAESGTDAEAEPEESGTDAETGPGENDPDAEMSDAGNTVDHTADYAWQDDRLPLEEAEAAVQAAFGSRQYTDEKNMSEHPGLLSAADVTGPFLEIFMPDDKHYRPDAVDKEMEDDPVPPEEARILPVKEGTFPEEYLELIQTDEKISDVLSGEKDMVCALLEYRGYSKIGDYMGGFELFNYSTRVSFFDCVTGELVAWMNTTVPRSSPMVLSTTDYSYDGNHSVLKFDDGTIMSDEYWTKALDELFYDENGYQVIGNRLISVPAEADPIVVPDNVTEISADVGHNHEATELILPNGLEKIGYAAFSHSAIEKAEIPDSVVFCDDYVLYETPWREAHSEDEWLIVGDGVLLDCNLEDEELTIPKEVKYIAPEALGGIPCKKITIPATVQQCFGSYEYSTAAAIMHMDSLEELVIEGGMQAAVPDTKLAVLSYCDNLKSVTVACDTAGELPDEWMIQNGSVYENMTMICRDGSAAAAWADEHGVKHHE